VPPPPPPKKRGRPDTVKLTYATAVGMGATHDFAADFSFIGFAADWRTRVTDNFWPGFTVAWQVLYNKEHTTLSRNDLTFTGTVAKTLNVFPILADADYFFLTDREGIRPYLGVGLGLYAAEHRIDWNIWTVQDTSWHFGFAPELGVVVPTGSVGLVFTTKFNYAFASGGWDEILYWNFNIGVEL
jgi:outer membrane protein